MTVYSIVIRQVCFCSPSMLNKTNKKKSDVSDIISKDFVSLSNSNKMKQKNDISISISIDLEPGIQSRHYHHQVELGVKLTC